MKKETNAQVIVVNTNSHELINHAHRIADAPIIIEKSPVENVNIEDAITHICKMRDMEKKKKTTYKKK